MLERTAGCLESGSLRRLLPVSRNSVRTHRTLHSSFWTHGGGDAELYPLWALMVQGVESQQECQQSSASSNSTLLDFLYPVATLNFIRQYSCWGVDKQEGRWIRPWFGRAGCRGYTSSAKKSGATNHTLKTDNAEQDEAGISIYEDIGVLYEKFDLQKDVDFEEAWRQYRLLGDDEQKPLRKLMIQYLCESERIVDAERVTELFESISQNQRDQSIYQQAIRSYLKLRNLDDATRLYKSAIKQLQTPVGSEDILKYHLNNRSWSRAFDFWKSVQIDCSQSSVSAKFDLHKSLETLPRLEYRALELARFVTGKIDGLSLADSLKSRSIDLSQSSTIEREYTVSRESQVDTTTSVITDFREIEKPFNGRKIHDSSLLTGSSTASNAAKPLLQRHKPGELNANETTKSNTTVVVDHGTISGSGPELTMKGARNNKQALPSLEVSLYTSGQSSLNPSVKDSTGSHQTTSNQVFADDILSANPGLIRFVSDIVKQALFSSQKFNPATFVHLLRHLHKWQVDTPPLYERAISMLFESHNTNLIPACYKMAHNAKNFYMSRRTLHTVLRNFCAKHDAAGIKMVLDDFFALHRRPDRLAYRMCLNEFSRQGDVQTVHALFEQYSSRYLKKAVQVGIKRQVDTADEFVPVLHVHARRGEVAEVRKIMEQIEDVYGMQPTIKCWNILLSAYSKVHEYEKAFDCFESILNDPNIHPSSYTMGTMMGMCATHGDLERTLEISDLARQLKIKETSPMVDALVLAYLRDDKLKEAEILCLETTARVDVEGSKTRMWNSLLLEYAMRRDLESVNRIIQRMAQLNIEFDEYTYAMLMQALAMVGQPDQAWRILKEVMREAGVKPSSFHYAIVMGGYITNRSYRNVFSIRAKMRAAGFKDSPSTAQIEMKASILFNRRRFGPGKADEQLYQALEIFTETMSSMNMQDIVETPRKGDGGLPLNITYPTMFYNYMIFVLGSCKEFGAAKDAYEAYRAFLPEETRSPISILTAVMSVALRQRDFDRVENFWKLAFSEAIKTGRPLSRRNLKNQPDSELTVIPRADVLSYYQLILSRPFGIYMKSLIKQRRSQDLSKTVKQLIDAGFALDNRNWNSYIVALARMWKYPKDAFALCESQLMPRWTGWSQLRWQAHERNRLPVSVYRTKHQGRYTRPYVATLLWLSRAFLDLEAKAADDTRSQAVLDDMKRECPLTMRAITTRPRLDNALERAILEGY